MFSIVVFLICLFPLISKAQIPGSTTTGFDPNEGQSSPVVEQNWIQRDYHYLIILVIGLIVLGLIFYYIIRSVRGMRRRLARENEQQLAMLNQIKQQHSSPPPCHFSPIDERAILDTLDQQKQQLQLQLHTQSSTRY